VLTSIAIEISLTLDFKNIMASLAAAMSFSRGPLVSLKRRKPPPTRPWPISRPDCRARPLLGKKRLTRRILAKKRSRRVPVYCHLFEPIIFNESRIHPGRWRRGGFTRELHFNARRGAAGFRSLRCLLAGPCAGRRPLPAARPIHSFFPEGADCRLCGQILRKEVAQAIVDAVRWRARSRAGALRGMIEGRLRGFSGNKGDRPSGAARFPNLFVLELFHGPNFRLQGTLAMQLLAKLIDHVSQGRGANGATIIGATSGDTGAAAIEGLSRFCLKSMSSSFIRMGAYRRCSAANDDGRGRQHSHNRA